MTMHSLWLLLAIVSASPEIGDGNLLFLQNCNSVVEFATRDEIGHVALAFREGKETWIYEATPGQVRRVTLVEYEQELARINARRGEKDQMRLWVLSPERKFNAAEISAMQEFLDDQLGRRYSIKNYVKGKPGDGTHCAELAANTLNSSGRFDLADSHKIHPARLMSIVEPEFAKKVEYPIGKPAVDPWYTRWGRCCTSSFSWCAWSCGEAWSFCW
jgi:hypothetical protein